MVGIYSPSDFLVLNTTCKTNGEHATSRPICIPTTGSLKTYVRVLHVPHVSILSAHAFIGSDIYITRVWFHAVIMM